MGESMNARTRLMAQACGFFSLIMLPTVLVMIQFLRNKRLNSVVFAGSIVLATFGLIMVVRIVAKLRGFRDDVRTRAWLEAMQRRTEAAADMKDAKDKDSKLLAELRGQVRARLSPSAKQPSHWKGLDDKDLQHHLIQLLRLLGRRVQRAGDSAAGAFDLVVDNSAIVSCRAQSKSDAKAAAERLSKFLRANPNCSAAILVCPNGFAAQTRYFTEGSSLILWDADNIARLVTEEKLA